MFETSFVDSVEKIWCSEVSVEDVKQEVLNLNVKKMSWVSVPTTFQNS